MKCVIFNQFIKALSVIFSLYFPPSFINSATYYHKKPAEFNSTG